MIHTAYIFALLALVSLAIYVWHTVQVLPELDRWDAASRGAGVLVWLGLFAFFWNIGSRHEDILWRQSLLAVVITVYTATQVAATVARWRRARR